MFQYNLIPNMKKLTRLTKNTATAIDHTITNSVFDNDFKGVIVKTDSSDHVPMIFAKGTGIRKDQKEHLFISVTFMKLV